MNNQNLLDRLASKDRKIERLEAEIKKLKSDCKAKNGTIASLRGRNGYLKSALAQLAEVTPNGYDRIEAWQAIANDCKHLD
jgi:septal ring factor EnvC (AmiA/AmiB activator)